MVMKKMFLSAAAVTALFIAGTSVASAQELTWGPKAGMNVSTMSHLDANAKVGFTAGVFGELRTNNWFAVSAEVLYSRQGVTDKVENPILEMTVKERVISHYLNVPVMANFYVTEHLALKTGVQVGFCLGARGVEKADGMTNKYSVGSIYHTADVAIPVGISYDLGPVVLDARYNFGVSHALKEGALGSRNNVFQLTAGLRF